MSLAKSLLNFCENHTQTKCWIAFSGGLDSCVLLHLCHVISQQTTLKFAVIHINHSISANAITWAKQCREMSAKYGIDYHECQLAVQQNNGESLEEVARNLRYQAFAKIMADGDLLLTAHHQNDQAETVLLQLLRGAGPKGLSAMPLIKSFAGGVHGRPLLAHSRAELQAYAEHHQLHWIEDESNSNCDLTRNFIRHEVMAPLKKRWPTVEAVLARSAALCAESQQLLEDVALDKLSDLSGSRANTLSVKKLLAYTSEWQRLLLRTWIASQGFALPDQKALFSIQEDVLTAERDRSPLVAWRGAEVRRHLDDLFVLTSHARPIVTGQWAWDMSSDLSIAGLGRLTLATSDGGGLRSGLSGAVVRFRQKGERVNVRARGRLSLKNLFQEWCVPAWERETVPLIFIGDELVQAVGYFLNPAFATDPGQVGIEIKLMRA